jgi:two-component system sensor histidine kinase HydH
MFQGSLVDGRMPKQSKMTGGFMADQIARIRAGPWLMGTINACALVTLTALDWSSAGALTPFYSLPVAVSALVDGWRGGLAAAVLSSTAVFTRPGGPSVANSAATSIALVCLSLIIAFIDRGRRQKKPEATAKPGFECESVQTNFEGMKRVERLSALGQLSAGLAHEIRNPLASIAGAAAILQRNEDLTPKHAKCIDIITNESRRLNGLLTNFLNFARPPAPHFQAINLHAVLDSVLSLANHGIRDIAVHCEKHIPPNLPRVEGDPEQLEQVLLNLMINAIEASPNGETVKISAEVEHCKVVIKVIDQGHGVPAANIDRLFDPFFTTKEHGTGLGLPVAHQIMTQMGGAILAQRGGERGMVFSVVLPAVHRDV